VRKGVCGGTHDRRVEKVGWEEGVNAGSGVEWQGGRL